MLLDAVARLGVVLIVLAGVPVAVLLFLMELRACWSEVTVERSECDCAACSAVMVNRVL